MGWRTVPSWQGGDKWWWGSLLLSFFCTLLHSSYSSSESSHYFSSPSASIGSPSSTRLPRSGRSEPFRYGTEEEEASG